MATIADTVYVISSTTKKRSITSNNNNNNQRRQYNIEQNGNNSRSMIIDSNDNNKRQKTTQTTTVGRVKYVSGDPEKDNVTDVSKFITGAARDDAIVKFPVTLYGKYDKSVNTCLKACVSAIPICSSRYETNIVCQLFFRENRNEMTIKCIKLLNNNSLPILDNIDNDDDDFNNNDDQKKRRFFVSKKTDYKILGGAISGSIRDINNSNNNNSNNNTNSSSVIRVAAIGPECVFIAARGIAIANEYLRNDNMDTNAVVTIPRFTKVQFDGKQSETNVLEICVFTVPSDDIDEQE